MAERFLGGLATVVSRRRRAVVAAWLALLAAGGWFSLHQSDHLSGGGWEVPGSPSLRVSDALSTDFPRVTPGVFVVFVTNRDGPRRRLEEVRRLVAREPAVRPGRPIVLDGGRAAILPLGYSGKSSNAIDEATRLRRLLVDRHTKVIGEPAVWSNFQDVSKRQLAHGELLGFPLILLILLAGFGTVVAAVAPLALGFVAVILSGAVIYGLSRSFEISVYVTNMASMIGIGVAVDYSLFIVSRFRRELHRGMSTAAALGRAMSSSGTAVVFSGLTVAVSLAALFTIDVNALRSMAVGAIVVVCISVLASVTLLPALLAAAGTRVERFHLPLPWRTGEEGSDAFWTRWAQRIMRHPVAAIAAGSGVLLVILAACYAVLLLLLRSVVLPLKAVLMNLLSVGAAYGVLVAVFQWGWLDWTGYTAPGYVDTVVPALVLAVTFGLSMDYEVFLLTRIRERYLLHGRNDQAVAEGLVGSARIITSAALVMVAVFAAFAVAGAPSLRELGAGLAVAVGLDASLVRLVVVPATMRLLGDWNWWVPRRLARFLPAPAPLG